MKLDVGQLKFLAKEEFRVLLAVELGQKNLDESRHGGTVKRLKVLLKAKLVHHENGVCDGYRLTYLGYDYLAIKTLLNRGLITSVGRQIGVGKEADVFEAMNEEGEVVALKLHRLGRTSFRAVKSKRDYLRHRSSFSWLYLSRLAAIKEFAFMKALGEHGFPVPKAIDNNRHVVLMGLVDAFPLVQVREVQNPGFVYRQCMNIMCRLTSKGLIHCDFNEFNLLIDDEENITLIDFPQMVSVGHGNARELFYRDVDCVIRFFKKKLGYIPEHDPDLECVRPDFEKLLAELDGDIGPELKASGFEREHQLTLEEWMAQQPAEAQGDDVSELNDRLSELGAADHSSEAGDSSGAEGEAVASESGEEAEEQGKALGVVVGAASEDRGTGGQGDSSGKETSMGDAAGSERLESREQEDEGCMQQPQAASIGRQLPSEGVVQERLAVEMRKAKQSSRMRSATKSARKSASSKGKKKGGAFDL